MTAHTYFPPSPANLEQARALIRGEHTTRAELVLACNVPCQSADADDRMSAREVRNVMWADRFSELRPQAQELAARRAKWAYLQADAMLAARALTTGENDD